MTELDEVREIRLRIKAHSDEFDRRMKEKKRIEQAELRGELLAAIRKAVHAGAKKLDIGRALGTSAYVTYNGLIQEALHGMGSGSKGQATFTEVEGGYLYLRLVNYSDFSREHEPITGEFRWQDEALTTLGEEGTFVDIEVFGETDTPLKRLKGAS
jgi:hypothetical protein